MRAIDDVRHAARALTRSPLYTTVAVLTLALGIGVTMAAFTVVGSVLLKPLPFADPDRLVGVLSATQRGEGVTPSYPDFEDFHRRADVFSGFAFVTGGPLTYRRPGSRTLQSTLAVMVTDEYFPLLRARPALGRLFTPADNRPGAPPTVVLSHDMWVDDFAASPAAIGATLDLGVGQFTVVGVLDAGQMYPAEWGDSHGKLLYVPLTTVPHMMQGGMSNRLSRSDARSIARLKDGVTRRQAERELATIAASLAAAYPADDSVFPSAVLRPLRDEVVGDIRPAFAVLSVAVVLVLVLACADVANLALVRATTREREIAVRSALGAGRGRIARALLAESGLVAAAGGALGVLVAFVAVAAFVGAAPGAVPRLDEVHVDWRTLCAALAATTACAVLCALAPLAIAGRGDLVPVLKAGGRGAGAARRGLRLRGAIVAGQVALSVVLIVGAGLLIRSFVRLRSINPGFDASHLIEIQFTVPRGRFADAASHQALFARVLDAMQIPGVASASLVNHPPLNGGGTFTPVGPDGRDPAADSVGAVYEIAGAHYFATMGIPVIEGRDFTAADLAAGAVPSIVSATAARRYWPNIDPIGREMTVLNSVHVSAGFGEPIRTTVIGVAADVKKFTLDESPYPAVYLPITHPPTAGGDVVVRTTVRPALLIEPVRRAMAAVDPDIAIQDINTGDATIAATVARQRFTMSLLTIFSGVALILAALGLYGVIAYSVTQRTSEMGIRMALGARAADIVRLVGRDASVLVATGLAVGVAGAWLLGRSMRALLYGVAPDDPVTLASVVGILAAVAALASYLPARRAARIDPCVALRSE